MSRKNAEAEKGGQEYISTNGKEIDRKNAVNNKGGTFFRIY